MIDLEKAEKRKFLGMTCVSQKIEYLEALQALDWEWLEDPSSYPFLRLTRGNGYRTKVSPYRLDPSKKDKIVVGVGRKDRRALALAYRKPDDYSAACYKDFSPQLPFSKPIEAVDTRILTAAVTPARSLQEIADYMANDLTNLLPHDPLPLIMENLS